MDWKNKLKREFKMAADARAVKNEGKARVCARRAAGVAIGEYLQQQDMKPLSASAYDLLKILAEMDGTPPEIRQASAYLQLRVTEDFHLPVNVDLVVEAEKICSALLPGWDE